MAFPTIAIAQPSSEGEFFVFPIPLIEPIPEPEFKALKRKPELSYSILMNCWAYVKSVYPGTPGTSRMLSNVSDSGEVGILYYPKSDLYHYVVVESIDGDQVTFSETNYNGHTKSTRTLPSAAFVGFYKLN